MDKKLYENIHKSRILVNILLYCNLRTGFLFCQILNTRSFKEIRINLETFLHTFALRKVDVYSDSESTFLKIESSTGGDKTGR